MKLTGSIKTSTALAIISLLIACTDNQETVATQVPTSVTVSSVISQTIIEWDEFTGRLQAPQSVELRPRISGYIEEVTFKEGAIVEAGQPLFSIDSRPFKAQVTRLSADLANVHSELVLRKTEYLRAKALLSKDAIAQELVDTRLAAYQQAQATEQSTTAALQLAKLDLSYTQVLAPIAGRVSSAIITKGNYVNAGQSLLTTIVSTDYLYAYFDADEQAYLKYTNLAQQGARPSSREVKNPVLLGLANEEDYPHEGYIDFVDNRIDPQTGTIRSRAVFNNENGLLIPGLFARIKIIGSAAYKGILIDDKAIASDLNQKYVLVVDDKNMVHYRPVVLGEKLAGLRIIKNGLHVDDRIIVTGLQRVRPGQNVNVQETEMANADKLKNLHDLQARVDRLDPTKQYTFSKSQTITNTNIAFGGEL